MRNLATTMAAIAAIAGVISVNLWRELRAERQLNEGLRTELTEARTMRPAAGLPDPGPMQQPAATVVAAAQAPATDPSPAPAQVGPIPGISPALPGNALEQQLMADPEYRKAFHARQSLALRRQHPGLAEELDLSAAEEGRFFDLLAMHEKGMADVVAGMPRTRSADQGIAAEISRIRQERQRELDDQLLGLLGGTRYGQWQAYQQMAPGRSRAMNMNVQLAQLGVPLNSEQLRPLAAALNAEQRRQTETDRAFQQDLQNADPQSRARLQMDMRRQRAEENNRRLFEAAAPHLTPQQLAPLRAELEAQEAMSRAARRVQQAAQPATAP